MGELTKTSNGYNVYEWEDVFPCDVADDDSKQNAGNASEASAQPTSGQGLETDREHYVSDVMTW